MKGYRRVIAAGDVAGRPGRLDAAASSVSFQVNVQPAAAWPLRSPNPDSQSVNPTCREGLRVSAADPRRSRGWPAGPVEPDCHFRFRPDAGPGRPGRRRRRRRSASCCSFQGGPLRFRRRRRARFQVARRPVEPVRGPRRRPLGTHDDPPIHVGHQDLRPSSTMTRSSGAAEAAASGWSGWSGWSAGPVEPDCHSDNPTSRPTPRRVIAGGPGRQVAAALTLARSAEGGAGRSMVQRCKGAASDEGGPVHPPNVEHLAVASSRVARSLGTGGLPARSPPQLPAPGGPPPAECSAAGPRRRRRRRSASCCSFRRGWPPASRVISAGDLAGGPGRLGAGPLRCRSRSAPPRVQLQVPQLRYCEATRTNLPSIDAQVPASSPLPAHGRPRDLPGTYQAGDACGSVSHKGFGVNTLDWYSHGRGSWGRYSLVAGVSGDRRQF